MKIAVIGGGVIGVSCATQLARGHAEVTLFTDADWASGASGRSLSWLNASGPWPDAYYQLRMAGIARYQQLHHHQGPFDWLKFPGGIFWSDSEEVTAWHKAETAHGYASEFYPSVDAVSAIEPWVNPGASDSPVLFNPGEGWVHLPDLITLLLATFTACGGISRIGCGKVRPVSDDNGQMTGIRLPDGSHEDFDKVLIAGGAETPALLASLGYRLPDGSVLSMLALSEQADSLPERVFNTPRVALRPHPGQALAIDHSWYVDDIQCQADGSYQVSEMITTQLFAEADRILSLPTPLVLAGYKAGPKPVPADGFPVLGAVPGYEGCFVAFTHSGATLALIIGELLSEEILCGTRHPMLADFRPERFHQ